MAPRVVIADSDELFRRGLRSVLEAHDITVVAETAAGRDAIEHARHAAVDVVITDFVLEGLSGWEVVKQLADEDLAPSVVLSAGRRWRDLSSAARYGASGFLSKSSPSPTLVAGVQEVAAGRRYLDPALATTAFTALHEHLRAVRDASAVSVEDVVNEQASTPPRTADSPLAPSNVGQTAPRSAGDRTVDPRNPAASLSQRELAVLRHVALGHTTAGIAAALGIAPDTAKHHVANVRKKLGVRTRTQAVVKAVQAGVLELD